jgi:uncharacterized protein
VTDLKVSLREIPCSRRFELGGPFVARAVAGLPIRTALDRPEDDPQAGRAVAEVDLYMEGDNVFVRGQLDGWVEVACGRCVGTVRLIVSEPLHVTFMPSAHLPDDVSEPADDDAVPPGEDDLDLYPYSGEEVDLEPLFRDQIILAVPFAPLCREDCKGLCPTCGTDLNTGTCTCERVPTDPRWSGLKGLKT